jgi:hypothetical protein
VREPAEGTADLSTALRSVAKHFHKSCATTEIHPLRFASVGMTRGGRRFHGKRLPDPVRFFPLGGRRTMIYPVEMTNLFAEMPFSPRILASSLTVISTGAKRGGEICGFLLLVLRTLFGLLS